MQNDATGVLGHPPQPSAANRRGKRPTPGAYGWGLCPWAHFGANWHQVGTKSAPRLPVTWLGAVPDTWHSLAPTLGAARRSTPGWGKCDKLDTTGHNWTLCKHLLAGEKWSYRTTLGPRGPKAASTPGACPTPARHLAVRRWQVLACFGNFFEHLAGACPTQNVTKRYTLLALAGACGWLGVTIVLKPCGTSATRVLSGWRSTPDARHLAVAAVPVGTKSGPSGTAPINSLYSTLLI